ncbi:hypothetical protein AD998_10850 [bacterium 336/3]|nr:hypothetical protein AD998_10850 [bacterium 336/3]
MKAYYLFLLFFVNILFTSSLQATHLMGGNFQIGRIDPIARAYCIQLYLYRDKTNLVGNGATAELADAVAIDIRGTKSGWMGQIIARMVNLRGLNADIQLGVYQINYTFAKSEECDENMTISFSESYLNGCTINTRDPDSKDFYIETVLNFEEADVVNNSVTYQEVSVIYSNLGDKIVHTPILEDPDKDSLSVALEYEMGLVKYLDLQRFTKPNGTVKIDEQNRFIWDAPSSIGCYHVGLRVGEWRKNAQGKYVQIASSTRYMHFKIFNGGRIYQPIKAFTGTCSPPLIGGSVNTDLIPKKFELQIYPNPSADIVVFTTTEAGELYVYNLIGYTLKEKINIEICGKTYINVWDWQNGVYIFYFKSKTRGKKVFQKFVKVGS